MLYIYMQAF